MLQINKIDHIGIATKDLQKSKEFFEHTLGLLAEPEIIIAERNLKICFFPIGDSALEVVAPTAPESPLHEHINKYGEGVYHIALGTEDITDALNKLRAADVPLQDTLPRTSKIGAQVAFLQQNAQTTNVSFELVKRIK